MLALSSECSRCVGANGRVATTVALTSSSGAYSHWNCDHCGRGPFADEVLRLHCPSCMLDICDVCDSDGAMRRVVEQTAAAAAMDHVDASSCPRCACSGAYVTTGVRGDHEQWRCDCCFAGPFYDAVVRGLCAACALDMCLNCQQNNAKIPMSPISQDGAAASEKEGEQRLLHVDNEPPVPSFLCPSGHPTQHSKRITSDWHCDMCQRLFRLGLASIHCSVCDYDCCPQCSELLASMTCPLQHPLPLSSSAPDGVAWSCDECHKPKGRCGHGDGLKRQHRCHCTICDYDVCADCFLHVITRQRALSEERKRIAAIEAAAAEAHTELQRRLEAQSLALSAAMLAPPPDLDLPPWGDGVSTTTLVLPGSRESIECLAALTPTLPANFELQGIEKIQNSLLYRRFHTQKRRIANENNGDSNAALAMHGTKGIPPRDIALDENGIDMRFGNSGCFFGRASYFSYDTKYVIENYAHTSLAPKGIPTARGGTTLYQFLVCEVSRGKAEARAMSNQIVRPSSGFHCIEGDVTPAGVKAVMCYELHQAYPRYLVTFLGDPRPQKK